MEYAHWRHRLHELSDFHRIEQAVHRVRSGVVNKEIVWVLASKNPDEHWMCVVKKCRENEFHRREVKMFNANPNVLSTFTVSRVCGFKLGFWRRKLSPHGHGNFTLRLDQWLYFSSICELEGVLFNDRILAEEFFPPKVNKDNFCTHLP